MATGAAQGADTDASREYAAGPFRRLVLPGVGLIRYPGRIDRRPRVSKKSLADRNGDRILAAMTGSRAAPLQVEKLIRKIRALARGGILVGLSLCALVLLSSLGDRRHALAGESDTWILIDIDRMSLSVMQGDTVVQTYSNISIGRGGATLEKKRGDGKTPLGEFHIVRITSDTPFHRFFGFDYPDLERVERARQAGTIGPARYAAIRKAIQSQRVPPQETVLGGYIGIHGVGAGNVAVHEDFNWTNGCIALTNAQIDELAGQVRMGTKVIIRR
ncbi:MAG: murein L,D-transpeptidase family protein [Thiogranum sp.]